MPDRGFTYRFSNQEPHIRRVVGGTASLRGGNELSATAAARSSLGSYGEEEFASSAGLRRSRPPASGTRSPLPYAAMDDEERMMNAAAAAQARAAGASALGAAVKAGSSPLQRGWSHRRVEDEESDKDEDEDEDYGSEKDDYGISGDGFDGGDDNDGAIENEEDEENLARASADMWAATATLAALLGSDDSQRNAAALSPSSASAARLGSRLHRLLDIHRVVAHRAESGRAAHLALLRERNEYATKIARIVAQARGSLMDHSRQDDAKVYETVLNIIEDTAERKRGLQQQR